MTRTLRARWLFSYIILILITAIILDIIVGRSLQTYLTHQIQKQLEDNLILIHRLVENSPLDSSLDEKAKDIGHRIHARVTFIKSDGMVLGDTEVPAEEVSKMENHKTRSEVIPALSGSTGYSIRHSHTLKNDLMYVAIPWEKDGKIQGVIRLALPLTHVEEIIQENRRWIYIGSLIAIISAIVIGLYFANSITQPIRQMVSAAQEIANEKFSQKIRVESHDELQKLGEALNTMSSKLESRFRDIQEEKNRLETILGSMTEGVMVLDNKGKVALTNDAFTKMLDLDVDTTDRTPLELIRNPDLAQALTEGLTRGDSFQKEIVSTGPASRVIRVYAAPLRQDRDILGMVAVFHDITDLRNLEQIRRDFVANVSHELRTPLTTVQGFSETLLGGALEDKEYAKKFVQNIYNQSQRMIELVEDLLCLSRIEAGKAEMKIESFNLLDSVNSAIDIVTPKAELRNIQIETKFTETEVQFSGDQRYMEQALINLLDNAIKFSSTNGKVTVDIQEKENNIEIKISDTGVGISSEHLSRIFERFYRVDKSRSVETEGTGLGLAIVKHIVDAHRGTIRVESTLGHGTTFILLLSKRNNR